MIDNRKDSKPDVLTAAKQTSTSGMNQDGNAVCMHNSTDLATIAAALTSIADELTRVADASITLTHFLSVTRRDGTDCAGLARIIYEKWRLGGCK